MKLKELLDMWKEHNKPEKVKERLKEEIEIQKLKAELDEVKVKRKPKSFFIGDVEVKQNGR